jgi:hypothetical protein
LSVCCECCVLSGRAFCVGLITRLEESYTECGVSECYRETSRMRSPWPTRGCRALKRRVNVKVSLCSMKQYIIKVYRGMDV